MQLPTASASPLPRQESKGEAVKGGVQGAAIEAAVNSLGGEVGKGATMLAAAGGLAGSMKKVNRKRQQEAAEMQ